MIDARYMHTASVLTNGKVLITGGDNGDVSLKTAELYDPLTETWKTTGSMKHARSMHTALMLTNGKVLVAGGDNDGRALNSTELYDPATGNWTTTGSMHNARYLHTASILNNIPAPIRVQLVLP